MDLSQFKSELGLRHKLLRVAWGICWALLFRLSPRPLHGWRRFLLRCFGAQVGKGVRIYNSARIYYPPYLKLRDFSVVGPHVDLYCVAPITIGTNSMVSQYAYLCTASHDYREAHLPLIASPITVGEQSWICAGAFVGPGITIGNRAVVAARAVVVKPVDDAVVVGGNPARFIKSVDDVPIE